MEAAQPHITAQDLTMAYGDFLIQKDLNFSINRGDIFIIMGGSGCGKSTLLKIMIGLKSPTTGDVFYDDEPFWASSDAGREATKRKFGTLFQSGALWSSMTLAENIGLSLILALQNVLGISFEVIHEFPHGPGSAFDLLECRTELVGLDRFAPQLELGRGESRLCLIQRCDKTFDCRFQLHSVQLGIGIPNQRASISGGATEFIERNLQGGGQLLRIFFVDNGVDPSQ